MTVKVLATCRLGEEKVLSTFSPWQFDRLRYGREPQALPRPGTGAFA